MAAEIDELISKESLKNWEQFVASLDKAVNGLDSVIKNAAELDAALGKLGLSSKDVRAQQDGINKSTEQAKKINKQLQIAEDDLVKAKIKFNQQTKEQRERLTALMTVEDKEAGTLEKLAARNKLLREEQRKLNLETAQGVKRNKEINAEINKNTAFIKQNSDALVKQKMNVGNYTGSIMAAGKELASFLGVAGGGAVILGKLKEAFMQTEQGVNFFKRASEGAKAFFQSIVKGNLTMAGPNALAAMKIAKEMNEVRMGDREDLVEIAKLETEISILRYKAADATLSEKEQLEALTQAQAKEDELIKYKIADKKEEMDVIAKMLAVRTDDVELWNEYYQLQADIISIEGERNLRLESRASALREKLKKGVVEVTEAEQRGITVSKLNTEQLLKGVDLSTAGKENELQFNEKVWESNEELHSQFLRIQAEEMAVLNEKINLQASIIDSLFGMTTNLYDAQLNRLEQQKEAELAIAGDNADQKEAIEEKYAKKKAAIQRKAAITEKIGAMFSIAVDTAKGVMNAMSKVATIPLVPWIIAQGAIQTALVASKPIPKYARGTSSSGEGLAVVGERGRELVITPSGQVDITGNSAELTYLKRGTKIIPAGQTEAILKAAAGVKRNTAVERAIEKGNQAIVKAIQEKETIILKTGVGNSIEKRQGNQYKTYFNRHIN